MLHLDADDYVYDDLVLDITNVVMENPYNDSKRLDTFFDILMNQIMIWMNFKIKVIWICNRQYLIK